MALFFETAGQDRAFVWLCALGFLAAMGCGALRAVLPGHARPACDVLLALLYGGALLSGLLLFPGGGPRAYHFLALTAGGALYRYGLKRLCAWLTGHLRRQTNRRAKNPNVRTKSIAKS